MLRQHGAALFDRRHEAVAWPPGLNSPHQRADRIVPDSRCDPIVDSRVCDDFHISLSDGSEDQHPCAVFGFVDPLRRELAHRLSMSPVRGRRLQVSERCDERSPIGHGQQPRVVDNAPGKSRKRQCADRNCLSHHAKGEAYPGDRGEDRATNQYARAQNFTAGVALTLSATVNSSIGLLLV